MSVRRLFVRRLDILSQTEGSLWINFSAFFRVDPGLQRLEGLEQGLRQELQVRIFAPNTEKYLIHTAGNSAYYNPMCLHGTPNKCVFPDCRYIESSVTCGLCNSPAC